MKNTKLVNSVIFLLSAVVICFEIISTRISSVVFVQNYAFIILSLSILGLSLGGIYSYYKFQLGEKEENKLYKTLFYSQLFTSGSFVLFVVALIVFNITNPLIYFFLLFLPFFFAGIVYAQLFKFYAAYGFNLYAFDLIGAASGSIISLIIFKFFNAPNAVLFLSLLLLFSTFSFVFHWGKNKLIIARSILLFLVVILAINGKNDFLGSVPIGNYPEKDFYYVYEDMDVKSNIVESWWSVNGRADLVEYDFQDMVKQLFIDGAAGSQMFRFNGNIANHDKLLNKLLLEFTTSIPLLFLQENVKGNMLVIGPGGGKEVLTGLLSDIRNITGVEVNQDFVDIVKKYKNFNGGIYTDFPNVKIEVAEGRNFVKKTNQKFDVLMMALPSTEQLQSIDNLASNENFLLTVEAIKDYLKVLSTDGELIFTVHTRWELVRLLTTSLQTLNENGISNKDAINHFIILGDEYAPTLVIKKNSYTKEEIAQIKHVVDGLPKNFPQVTYFPYSWNMLDNSVENILLKTVGQNEGSLKDYVQQNSSDISPVRDDSPFFYKVNRGIPGDYLKLFLFVAILSLIVVSIPVIKLKSTITNKRELRKIFIPLIAFVCIGFGFMVLEVSLFQKLILYLGTPTVSLSILLASILVGMGIGSYLGGRLFADNPQKRLAVISLSITIVGLILFFSLQYLLNQMMVYSLIYRSMVCFFLIMPFGFLLGIPFASGIQILQLNNMSRFIPWMYSVNGILTVLGSVSAVILSMTFGFKITFLTGISAYFLLFIILFAFSYNVESKR
jgi:hypothetical protein